MNRNTIIHAIFAITVVAVAIWGTSEYLQARSLQARVVDGDYQVKEPGDQWRMIMLPGTKLGFTIQAGTVENGKIKSLSEPSYSEAKNGQPSKPEDFDPEYFKNVQVLRYKQVSDGNYCVELIRPTVDPAFRTPTWTVWTKELFETVQEAQKL